VAIIEVVTAVQRPERGWDDPGYPIATWIAAGAVTGNATGGDRVIQVNLRTIGTQPGLAFSLETLTILDTEGTAKNLSLLISNFEPSLVPSGISKVVLFPLVLAQHTTNVGYVPTRPGLGLFMGVAVVVAVTTALSFRLLNADTEVLQVSCAGYTWGPRSVVQAPGGYRRPADGMFG